MERANQVTIVLHDDRHADPEVHVFAEQAAAIDFAKERLLEYDRHGDRRTGLTEPMKRSGWLFYGTYRESNSIRVEAKVVR